MHPCRCFSVHLLLLAAWLGVPAPAFAQRRMEFLGRGVVAVRQGAASVYVSWRLLGTDPDEIAFNLYRSSGGGPLVRLNPAPLTQTTDFVDPTASFAAALEYIVRSVLHDTELAPGAHFTLPANAPTVPYLSIPLTPPPNGTKATPALSADLFGDWREEVVLRSADDRALRIYTTTIPATNRLPTLMHDPQYRLAIAWQNVAYNQPPHPGFYLGDGMSRPPTPLIQTGPRPGRLANLAVRARVDSTGEPLIAGFFIETTSTRTVLIRVVGPGLAPFGVTGAVPDPQLTLFRGSTRLAANDDWNRDSGATAAAFASFGAFPLAHGSKDAALILNLPAGSYTVHAGSADGAGGIALIEIYDID